MPFQNQQFDQLFHLAIARSNKNGIFNITCKKASHLEVGLRLVSMFDEEGYKSAVSEAEYFDMSETSIFDHVRIWAVAAIGYRY